MSIGIAEARPPYIQFERTLVEDREASQKAGHYCERAEDHVHVTPIGSKDRYRHKVNSWFKRLEKEVQNNRFRVEWLQSFKAAYAAFCNNEAPPTEGTSLRSWPQISRGQIEACIAANIRTIEDLAAANEEAVMRLGMGGRALKQSAVAWLEASSGVGKVAAELAELRHRLATLEARNGELEKTNAVLSAASRVAEAPAAQPASNPLEFSASDLLDEPEPPKLKPLK